MAIIQKHISICRKYTELKDLIGQHCPQASTGETTNYSQATQILREACQRPPPCLCNSSWLKMCQDISTTCQEPSTHNSTFSLYPVHLTYCKCPPLHLLYIYTGVYPCTHTPEVQVLLLNRRVTLKQQADGESGETFVFNFLTISASMKSNCSFPSS